MTGLLPPLDKTTLTLLIAGMVGSFLHALVTFDRRTLSRQTAVETVLGGLAGPLLQSIPVFLDLRPWGQVVATLVITYAVPDVVINLIRQLAAKWGAKAGGSP